MDFFFMGVPVWFAPMIWLAIVGVITVGGYAFLEKLGEIAPDIALPLALVAVPLALFVVYKILNIIKNDKTKN